MEFKRVKNEYQFNYMPCTSKKAHYTAFLTHGAGQFYRTFNNLDDAREWAKQMIIHVESRGLVSEDVEV